MDHSIRALVAVEGLDAFDVQRALPDDASFTLVAMTEGVDETVRALVKDSPDLLVVACQGREDDRSLQIIDGAHHSVPRRADHRARLDVAERVPPAGVRGRGRRHGDLPADEGAAALRDEHRDRTPSGPAGAAVGAQGQPADLRARPEGRDGQDPHVDEPRDGARPRGQEGARDRPRPPVRGRCPLPGAPAREDDVRPRDLARRPRRGQAEGLRDDARHGRRRAPRAREARPGERDHDRPPARRPRNRATQRTTSSSPTPRRASRRR